jgi:hypothetical protein
LTGSVFNQAHLVGSLYALRHGSCRACFGGVHQLA